MSSRLIIECKGKKPNLRRIINLIKKQGYRLEDYYGGQNSIHCLCAHDYNYSIVKYLLHKKLVTFDKWMIQEMLYVTICANSEGNITTFRFVKLFSKLFIKHWKDSFFHIFFNAKDGLHKKIFNYLCYRGIKLLTVCRSMFDTKLKYHLNKINILYASNIVKDILKITLMYLR